MRSWLHKRFSDVWQILQDLHRFDRTQLKSSKVWILQVFQSLFVTPGRGWRKMQKEVLWSGRLGWDLMRRVGREYLRCVDALMSCKLRSVSPQAAEKDWDTHWFRELVMNPQGNAAPAALAQNIAGVLPLLVQDVPLGKVFSCIFKARMLGAFKCWSKLSKYNSTCSRLSRVRRCTGRP